MRKSGLLFSASAAYHIKLIHLQQQYISAIHARGNEALNKIKYTPRKDLLTMEIVITMAVYNADKHINGNGTGT